MRHVYISVLPELDKQLSNITSSSDSAVLQMESARADLHSPDCYDAVNEDLAMPVLHSTPNTGDCMDLSLGSTFSSNTSNGVTKAATSSFDNTAAATKASGSSDDSITTGEQFNSTYSSVGGGGTFGLT